MTVKQTDTETSSHCFIIEQAVHSILCTRCPNGKACKKRSDYVSDATFREVLVKGGIQNKLQDINRRINGWEAVDGTDYDSPGRLQLLAMRNEMASRLDKASRSVRALCVADKNAFLADRIQRIVDAATNGTTKPLFDAIRPLARKRRPPTVLMSGPDGKIAFDLADEALNKAAFLKHLSGGSISPYGPGY